MARPDPHSFFDPAQPRTVELDWKAKVDFGARILEAEATLSLDIPAAFKGGPLDLDTRDLAIDSVDDTRGRPLAFALGAPEPIVGARLRIELPRGVAAVRIRYRTSPKASALQWLTPAQTAGGRHPFLFSQCQAVHARSVVPLQDTPRLRVRYTAELTVPAPLRALMAAGAVGREVKGDVAVERWRMPQPIPPYLFAFAVGELESRDLGPRSRVWAEPSVVEKAAFEFAGVDAMLGTAERLFGPYDWDRFDVLTMPPSFPYGGMENPRLTFLTPTLLAGDRSLVNVLAHELAHSWTGNLVTNADANHFWLNEGFTVFAERRILEALEGAETCALHAALGRRELDRAVEQLSDHPEWTWLRTSLAGVDPDEAYSLVPYEKGYLFLRALEEAAGREAFDGFLRNYVASFRFRSLTTEEFEAFAETELPGALQKAGAEAWLRGPGIPANAPAPRSSRLEALRALGGKVPEPAVAKAWTPTEWALFLESVPHPALLADCALLEERFRLTGSANYEILVAWLDLAVQSGFAPALPRVEAVLREVGRMKYLKPLFQALAKGETTRALARSIYERRKEGYHPIAQQAVEGILKKHGA